MTNYISINGNKIELTDEQVQQIKKAGVVKENPFERVKKGSRYFAINPVGVITNVDECRDKNDAGLFKAANYCTDKKLMEQRALHETLNRLLWRFSMTHGGEEIDWGDGNQPKPFIYYDHDTNTFDVCRHYVSQALNQIYFKDEKTAKQAIEEIVKPFIEEHPEFVW